MDMVSRASVAQRKLATVLVSVSLVASVALPGCAPTDAEPAPTATASTTPTPTPTPAEDPELVEGGTAGQNRPYFEFVIDGLLTTTPQPPSLTVVDTLTAAGFPREAIQVTPDTTRVGEPADSILFSVLIGDQCLIGQVAGGTRQTQLTDVLGTGRCLVGRTLSLD